MSSVREMNLDQLAVGHHIDVNTLTGTAQLSVPIRTSPGRESFGPSLALGYSSGQKNSTFGVGWFLSGVPSIGIDTSKELPTYSDDRYVYAGGQELVPMLWELEGAWIPRIEDTGTHLVQRFRSKIERSFERFERWTDHATGRVHWVVYARNGVVSVFGRAADNSTRIADPSDPDHRTFQWLLEAQYQPKGNAIVFQYKSEDGSGVDTTASFEAGRARVGGGFAQRYLKRILYGNSRPLSLSQPDDAANAWRFEIVFDYGEHAAGASAVPSDTAPAPLWTVRPDAFSTHRPGFELRTYRMCRRILMFHRFPELNDGNPCLIGATELTHRDDPAGSVVEAIRYRGYRRNADGSTSERAVPALTLGYGMASVGRAFEITSATDNIPSGVDGAAHQWIDLRSEGLHGILCRQNGSWYFKENLGGGRFGPMNAVDEVPAAISAAIDLQDFDADGNLNLVGFEGREAGYYEHDRRSGLWENYRTFEDLPRIDVAGARAQWVDLNGDGYTDLIVERSDRLSWYPSEGAKGFGAAIEISRPDVRAGGAPTLTQRASLNTFFADMTGDGLLDMVRVDAGRVEYWPNLGRGQFGPGVVMEDPPALDDFGEIDPRRLRLVDLDNSGTADLLYIGRGEIRLWTNQSGNRFGAEQRLTQLPYIDRLASAQILDLLGDGTRCLVWSTPLPGHEGQAIQFLPLTGVLPPRLLISVASGVGRETILAYRSSAEEYLRDKNSERPWRSRLPQHSMVVERLEAIDRVGGNRLVTRYEYRDGYFDDEERRFVGFGLVDGFDSDHLATGDGLPADVSAPAMIRTWYHTGEDGGFHTRARDFYSGDPLSAPAPAPELTNVFALTTAEQLDGFRAIAGTQWRQEIYALRADGTSAPHPFRTTELAYRIRRLQPAFDERAAAFAFEQSESLVYEYEQESGDPRVAHEVVLRGDEVGNVEARVAIAYPRRPGSAGIRPEQQVLHAELIHREYRNVDTFSRFELGIEFEERRYALGGIVPGAGLVFSRADLADRVEEALAHPLAYHDPSSNAAPNARLIGYKRNRFWNDAQSAIADPGTIAGVTLLHHVERAAFPEASVDSLFEGRVDPALLTADGHYRLEDGFWWAEDNTFRYGGSAEFFRLREETSPDGARQTHTFDPHSLIETALEDIFGNRAEVTPDYQALAAARIRDPNDNVSEVVYDALGVQIATSQRGEQIGSDGNPHTVGDDDAATYVPVPDATAADVLADPGALLQGATRVFFYDLHAFESGDGPPCTISLEREQHRHDGEGTAPGGTDIRTTVEYLDGFGRAIQTKLRGEGGQWLTTGHNVYNNKGWLARTYEPRFSTSPGFDSDQLLLEHGVATSTRYDPFGRIVRQDLPNGTLTTIEYSSWATREADANDNVIGSAYETAREALPTSHVERRALDKARAHANTLTIVECDPQARPLRLRETGLAGTERISTMVYGPLGLPEYVIDPRNLTALTYRYDMLGRALLEESMDAGRHWTLLDIRGHGVHQWDALGVHTQRRYDENGRHVETQVDAANDFDGTAVAGNVVEQVTYGDNPEVPQARLRNARGRAVRRADEAGVVFFERYHMDGQPIDVRRELRSSYKGTIDWRAPAAVAFDGAAHRSRTRVDALGRVVEQQLPDGVTRAYVYARLGHVADVRVSTADGAYVGKVIASDIQINARQQRTRILLGNSVEVAHEYDAATFNLARLYAHRVAGAARDYLDVEYTYDPVGNVTHLIDRVQDPGFPTPLLTGLTVSAACEFTYDAFYQLTEATGRVHQALLQHDYRSGIDGLNPIKGTRHITLDNGAAVERYTRIYDYDIAGNIRSIRHQGTTHNWITEIWTSATSNRSLPMRDLDGLEIADSEARFDANGNVIRFPHLRAMNWNYARKLSRAVVIDRSGSAQPDDAEYYVYGGDGRRVRRVTERLVDGQLEVTDTTYLEDCEIRRITLGGNTRLLRTTSQINDGSIRLATLHQWTIDQTALETDDVGTKKLHYIVGNHLGSVSLELNDVGDVISYEEYFPFGATSFLAGPNVRDVKRKECRYSGKILDDATGLYCYEYRYYAPFIGNWISPDPVGPLDGLNLYRFVHNNPIRFVDALGLLEAVPGPRPGEPQGRGATGREQSESATPSPPPRPPPPNPPRPSQGGGTRRPTRGERRPAPPRPPDLDREPPPQPAVPPAETAESGDPAPAPAERDETPDPRPHYSDCECVWIPAGLTTDWGTLVREGRFTQVWQEGHLECTGPCRGGGGTEPGPPRRSDAAGESAGGPARGTGAGGEQRARSGSHASDTHGPLRGGADAAEHTPRSEEDPSPSDPGDSQSTSEEIDRTQTTVASGDERSIPGSDSPSASVDRGAPGINAPGPSVPGAYTRTDNGGPVTLRYSDRNERRNESPIPWDRVTDIDWISFAPLALDIVQTILDVIGMIPGIGEIADGANGLISLGRGHYGSAALSFAAMVPFAGWFATAGKQGRNVARASNVAADVGRAVVRHADDVVRRARASMFGLYNPFARRGAQQIQVVVGSPLHAALDQSLRGFTKHGDAVADAIARSDVTVHLLNNAGFNAMARQAGDSWVRRMTLDAYASTRDIYIRMGRDTLNHIVHESDHVMRTLAGTSTYNAKPVFRIFRVGAFTEEWAVRRAEREFAHAAGLPHNSAIRDAVEVFFYLFRP